MGRPPRALPRSPAPCAVRTLRDKYDSALPNVSFAFVRMLSSRVQRSDDVLAQTDTRVRGSGVRASVQLVRYFDADSHRVPRINHYSFVSVHGADSDRAEDARFAQKSPLLDLELAATIGGAGRPSNGLGGEGLREAIHGPSLPPT